LIVYGSVTPFDRIGTGTKPPSQLNFIGYWAVVKGHGVGVANHKTTTLYALPVHITYSVAASAAYAENFYC